MIKTPKPLSSLLLRANSPLMRLCFLGLLSGIVAAIIIVLFRLLLSVSQSAFLPDGNPENYEALPWYLILMLPLIGGILVGALFSFLSPESRKVGITHTLEQLKNHQGKLPLTNFLAQFFGAAICIIFGHSVGREGPSVHLGAGGGYYVAYLFNLPEKTRRTLIACGAAAAIAASFNTPIAAVIFALEVIMLQYTIVSIMPVIIASLAATLISHAVFGSTASLLAPAFDRLSNGEIPIVIICGIFIGLLAVSFNRLLLSTAKHSQHISIFWRLTLAGAITGLLGLAIPQILSIGYDTITATFHNDIALVTLIGILVFKLLATSIGLGLGLPGGLICPALVIGAVAGSIVGVVAQMAFPESTASPGLYAMIGMGAMMGAVLHAPLAALLAIFELTLNPHILMPGLIAIVTASLVASELFKQPSIFISLMKKKTSKTHSDSA